MHLPILKFRAAHSHFACGLTGTVAKLMGHSTPSMILNHYQYVMDGQKRAVVETLPDIQYVPKPMCPKRKALTKLS